ncbi:MAG: hypothetical protein IJ736_00640, partial [Firmicutes bacterium]|nr:hypothetical protein [Bacillota bacterium]
MLFDKIKSLFSIKGKGGAESENTAEEVTPGAGIEANSEEENMQQLDEEMKQVEQIKVEESVAQELDQMAAAQSDGSMDAALEELMRQDAAPEIEEKDYDFIEDVSVYDTMRKENPDGAETLELFDEMGEPVGKGEEEEEPEKSYTLFYIIVVFLIIIMMVSCGFLFILIGHYSGMQQPTVVKEEKTEKKETMLKLPEYTSNKASSIYVSEMKEFDGMKLKLSRILFDSTTSVFYFDVYFNADDYNITLKDDRGSEYAMDMTLLYTTQSADKTTGTTMLRFDPVSHMARKLYLGFEKIETGEKVDFEFLLEKRFTSTPVKYVTNHLADRDDDEVDIDITSAVFSSASTKLEYTINYPENSEYSIEHGKGSDYIQMEEGSRKIKKLRKEPLLYSFPQDGFMMARMDFESINNLNSKVTFIFSDLFKKYSVNEDISSEDIPDKKIIKGNSRIVFEGLGAFNDRYVLVLHGEDVNIPYDEIDENANRIEVQADAELVAVTPSGMEVVIKGV